VRLPRGKHAAVESEIAAGRIALFTPLPWFQVPGFWFLVILKQPGTFHLELETWGEASVSVALALLRGRLCGLSGPTTGPAPAFARHPALCSSDFPLPPRGQRPPGAVKPCPTLSSCIAAHKCPAFVKSSSVPGQGLEPQLTDPKSAVLPLDDPGLETRLQLYSIHGSLVNFD
jgi:hypothetical protein